MNKYRMNRFQPTGEYPERSEETRNIVAESEEEAYTLIGEPEDGSYWSITDTKPAELRDYLAGIPGRMFCTCPAGDCLLKIPGVMLPPDEYCRKGETEGKEWHDIGDFADEITAKWREHHLHRDVYNALNDASPLKAAALAMLVYHRLQQNERMAWYAFVCRMAGESYRA